MKRVFAFVFTACLCVSNLHAAIVSFDVDTVFTGWAPESSEAWLNVTFDDQGSAGSVNMTLTATNLTGNEKLSQLYLNLDPSLNPTSLDFSTPAKVGTFSTPTISQGTASKPEDQYKADGDGYFDVLIQFDVSEGSEFGSGESITYIIDGIASLTAESFLFLSYNKQSGAIGYPVAAHVHSIGQAANSGWLTTVPEPGTLAILGVGSIVLLRKRRMR